MAKIPRVRERTASAQELRDDEERCRRAREKARQGTTPANEGNLCKCLVMFAAWRPCCVCGSLTLYVNENVRTDSDFECGRCKEIRENLARWLRPALPVRAALHLLGLFSTAIDNREVAHAS
jgi:hypothetical protein